MSCVISTSDEPEGIWSIRNSIYEIFVAGLMQRFGSESRVGDCLKRSQYFQALDLESLRTKEPEFACEMIDALLVGCREIGAEQGRLFSERARPFAHSHDEVMSAFADLSDLLTRFRSSITSSKLGEKG